MQKQNIFLPHADFPSVFWSYPTFMKEKYSFSQYCSIRWAKQEQFLVKQVLISKIIIYKLFVQTSICQMLYSAPAQSSKQNSRSGRRQWAADGRWQQETRNARYICRESFWPGKILERAFLPSGAQSSFVQVPHFAVIEIPETPPNPLRAQHISTAVFAPSDTQKKAIFVGHSPPGSSV